MAKRMIEQVDVRGRTVLMRVDFNVPLDSSGGITDDRRVTAALPSVRGVIERGGKLILLSHLGRPKGSGPEPAFSLAPVAERLRALLPGTHVSFVPDDCVGAAARAARQALKDGEVLLLENVRFDRREKDGDPEFAAALAEGADIYCNDAFGTAHRNDASMYALPNAMSDRPRVAGFLLAKELRYLSDALSRSGGSASTSGRFTAVLGGAKVSDKLKVVEHLLTRVDDILIGGAMAYTFLRAAGTGIGASRVEESMLSDAERMLQRSGKDRGRLHLPVDHHVATAFSAEAERRIEGPAITEGWMGLDIGPVTMRRYADLVRGARTVVWNGPMGVFEMPPFDAGTRAVAEALVAATEAGATTIVGGGDSAAAIEQFGLAECVSHVSTGGGASLEMLEGRTFDSVELLEDASPA